MNFVGPALALFDWDAADGVLNQWGLKLELTNFIGMLRSSLKVLSVRVLVESALLTRIWIHLFYDVVRVKIGCFQTRVEVCC